MELLADTHRRKAKVQDFRVEYEGKSQGEIIKGQIGMMRKEKQAAAGKSAPPNRNNSNESNAERMKAEMEERAKYRAKMSEPLVIIDKVVYEQYLKELES